ncbi:MAG: F0F1 ATP synthase subunit delta [Oscillospiraceae bacterium]|nr:F0F1 ATP synthase subunit delta [Oscillospiraceae bacterium]
MSTSENNKAYVVSAVALRVDQLSALADVLSRKLRRPVEVLASVDETLLGGLYIRVDGRVIDRTVKKQLRDMKESLKKGAV